MTRKDTTVSEQQLLALQAYHDGELSRLGRWRFERALRRCPGLRRELDELRKLSGWIREIESDHATSGLPDVWSDIGPALSRVDAEIGHGPVQSRSRRRDDWSWGSLLGGGALAAAVLAMLVLDSGEGIPEHPFAGTKEQVASGSLRYLQTHGVSYVVSQETEDVTIIWLMDAPQVVGGV
ncbi:MAG: zf-HC2 domain-containing protein [bacterium]|nr:zf-HC2 domain-containing protein [bacterium]